MPDKWEQYAEKPEEVGSADKWEKYAEQSEKPMQPAETEQPGLLSRVGSAVLNQYGIGTSPEDVSEAGSALGSDLWGMVKGAPRGIAMSLPGLGAAIKGRETYQSLKETGKTPEQLANERRMAAGYGKMYRYGAAPLAEGIGVNVHGMEESAKQGSVGGVMGHASALPVATLATYGLSKAAPPVARAINTGRSALAERIVSPLVYEGTGEALADLRTGHNAARGVVREGMVGSKEGLVGKTGMEGKIGDRVAELKSRADQILSNHPNSRVAINVEGEIDSAINDAINAEQKAGANEVIPRLENLREALKTKFGKTTGTPKEINDLKTEIQQAAKGRGAYKNVVPMEGSTANALRDVASRIRARVDQLVPEAAEVNQRMSDLLDAPSAITKKLVQERGGGRMPGEGMWREGFRRTLGSAPVRTGAARMLTLGQKAPLPQPLAPYAGPEGLLGSEAPGYADMLRSRLRPYTERANADMLRQRMMRQKALPPIPTPLGSSMEPITPAGPPSVQLRPLAGLLGEGKIPLRSSMEGIEPLSPPARPFIGTRAERLGLMLPEKASSGQIGLQDYGYPSPAGPGEVPKTSRFSPGRFVGETRNGRWWDGEKWRLDKPQ